MPEEKAPRLRALCPRCLSHRSEEGIIYLEPLEGEGAQGWKCPRCGFALPLEEPP